MFISKSFLHGSSSCRAAFTARRAALTTVEAIGMIVILGLMAGLSYPAITGLQQAGMDQQAVGVAQTINQAQQTYNLRVATAETNWESAQDSPTKYQLISQYVPYATAALSNYEPSGYTLTLGPTLSSRVTITGPTGAPVNY